MFYYSVTNYDYSVKLMHEKLFTQEEFVAMCKEYMLIQSNCVTVNGTKRYLIDKFNFKEINDFIVGSFNVDEANNY